MDQKDLKKYFKSNPQILADRQRTQAVLSDYFNGDNIKVRRMMKGYDHGIVNLLDNEEIDGITKNNFIGKLIRQEDLKENVATDIYVQWEKILSKNFTIKQNVKKQNNNTLTNNNTYDNIFDLKKLINKIRYRKYNQYYKSKKIKISEISENYCLIRSESNSIEIIYDNMEEYRIHIRNTADIKNNIDNIYRLLSLDGVRFNGKTEKLENKKLIFYVNKKILEEVIFEIINIYVVGIEKRKKIVNSNEVEIYLTDNEEKTDCVVQSVDSKKVVKLKEISERIKIGGKSLGLGVLLLAIWLGSLGIWGATLLLSIESYININYLIASIISFVIFRCFLVHFDIDELININTNLNLITELLWRFLAYYIAFPTFFFSFVHLLFNHSKYDEHVIEFLICTLISFIIWQSYSKYISIVKVKNENENK